MTRSLALVVLFLSTFAGAQTPTGTMAGTVTDPTGAVIAGAHIQVRSKDTGLARAPVTGGQGEYSASSLPVGDYEVTAEAAGFRLLAREALVEAGSTTSVNFAMQVGDVSDTITVEGASPQIQFESNQVGGVVTRNQIESLPLNGRNFLDLAQLEPGVTPPGRITNNRMTAGVLGAPQRGGGTRVTIDGGSIMYPATIGSMVNASQEVVQEFQIATVSLDAATGLTSSGAINIVTRSGGNEFHGSAFAFYRDHNLAAYPALSRDVNNPDPFFQRRQYGYFLGGPIRRDRAFFFTSYERSDQRGAISLQPRTPDFSPLGGIFASPFQENQWTVRFDLRLHPNHNLFLRHTNDNNHAFQPLSAALASSALPSRWSQVPNWVDQSAGGLTSTLTPALVNDARFFYVFMSTPDRPAHPGECPRTCVGLGSPQINIPDAGITLGNPRNVVVLGRRYQFTDGLAWQKGNHRLRFGFEWEHITLGASGYINIPASLTLYSPNQVRIFNSSQPAASRIPLPLSSLTVGDILQLPLLSFVTDVGDPRSPTPGFRKFRAWDMVRLYAADSSRVRPDLTVNYGLSWVYEPHNLNYDLTKPLLLVPLVGQRGLAPATDSRHNFAPSVGAAWSPGISGKTVVRAGAGLYYDALFGNSVDIGNERVALGPRGIGLSTIAGTAIPYNGSPLDFRRQPTAFTGAQLLALIPGIRADLLSGRNPYNRDFSVVNIEADKAQTSAGLTDPFYVRAYGIHFNAGLQRQLARDLVIGADFVVRHFVHLPIFGIDYNRYNSASGPVIPKCVGAQAGDVRAICSNGPILFDNSTGLARYTGLLVRIDKRFSRHIQFLGSYALATNVGSNGTALGFNLDNWFENVGSLPTDQRHTLNLSGIFELPQRFQLSLSTAYYSMAPFSAFVSGIDFNGDGTQGDLLPGTRINQFGRTLNRDDLRRLVGQYNQTYASKRTPSGQTAPALSLPARFAFGDSTFTQNLRLGRTFVIRERARLSVFGEVFNLPNTANLTGYSGNLLSPSSFGQPSGRADQVFGSGGPRAFQLGGRVSF